MAFTFQVRSERVLVQDSLLICLLESSSDDAQKSDAPIAAVVDGKIFHGDARKFLRKEDSRGTTQRLAGVRL